MDYSQDFTLHHQSQKADELFIQARQLKTEDRANVRNYKAKKFFRCVILGAIGAAIGFMIVHATNYIDAIDMEGPMPLAIIFGFFGCMLGLAIAVRRTKEPKQHYPQFYYNHILGWAASVLGINSFKIGRATNEHRQQYANTGLGDKSSGSSTVSVGLNYKIGSTPVYAYDIVRRRKRSIGFTGFVYTVKLNHPLDYTIRIDSAENWQKLRNTANALSNNQHRYEFNSTEMAQKFVCTIEPTLKRDRRVLDDNIQHLRQSRDASPFGSIKQVKSAIDLRDARSLRREMDDFESPEVLGISMLDTAEIITPLMEEFLIYLRKKYGPYTMVISDNVYIQVSSTIFTGPTPFKTDSPFGIIFGPKINNDKDISLKSLQRASDVLHLGVLINDIFNHAEGE